MDLNTFKKNVDNCVNFLIEELANIHTGRANPALVEGIKVEAYGMDNPLKNVAGISVSDSKSLIVTPWDKGLKENIVKAVNAANLGFLPSVEGDSVRIKIPDLTQERREQYVKVMKEKVEHSRISVRNVRQEGMKEIDDSVKNGLPEDEGKRLKEEVEKYVKSTNEKIEEIRKNKETDLLTV
jgi:ribosome recycling factor